jgi:hypothetical protein
MTHAANFVWQMSKFKSITFTLGNGKLHYTHDMSIKYESRDLKKVAKVTSASLKLPTAFINGNWHKQLSFLGYIAPALATHCVCAKALNAKQTSDDKRVHLLSRWFHIQKS